MKTFNAKILGSILFCLGMMLSLAVKADFELTGPDGRRVLLRDNGTWRYLESREKDAVNGKAVEDGEALLLLEGKTDHGPNCRFAVKLINHLTYEIRSFVPYFSAYRANGVLHDSVASLSAFTILRPGDQQTREIEFSGIACRDIARVQVVGGDRCEMGELTKFSDANGQCLARVRVVGSDLVRFEK